MCHLISRPCVILGVESAWGCCGTLPQGRSMVIHLMLIKIIDAPPFVVVWFAVFPAVRRRKSQTHIVYVYPAFCGWRQVWDLNPRNGIPFNGLANRRFRPLSQLAVCSPLRCKPHTLPLQIVPPRPFVMRGCGGTGGIRTHGANERHNSFQDCAIISTLVLCHIKSTTPKGGACVLLFLLLSRVVHADGVSHLSHAARFNGDRGVQHGALYQCHGHTT